MIVVGLTGNFGMGKSAVARMFRELGAYTIDTDELVGKILLEQDTLESIRETFGEEVLREGRVDKAALADAVFEHPHLRIALENILHARVFGMIAETLPRLHSDGHRVVVIEAPILFERGYQNRFDRIITVHTTDEVALQRLEARGISRAEGLRRLRSQFPVRTKVAGSDWEIDNSGTPEETRRQVESLYRELIALSAEPDGYRRGPSHHGNN